MGRGLSSLQRSILDEARNSERGFVLYEELITSLWPTAVDAAIAAVGSENERAKDTLLLSIDARYNSGLKWDAAKAYFKAEPPDEPNAKAIYLGMVAYDATLASRPTREASLSRALDRLEQRGLVKSISVRRRDKDGKSFGPRLRAVELTVNPEKLTDRTAVTA